MPTMATTNWVTPSLNKYAMASAIKSNGMASRLPIRA
jgi:hypothetical protein